MSDYLKCPRLYFLRNVYRDPKTRHKISLITPPLALGQVVHETIEVVSKLPVEKRFTTSLVDRFTQSWESISGMRGGFQNEKEEAMYKTKGIAMIERVQKNKGPLARKTVKIRQDLPHYWLSEEDNIILCGKIDWLEYNEASDSINIVDFKTGKHDEDPDSLQLPIYYLIVSHCQNRSIDKLYYWYLDRDDEPLETERGDIQDAEKRVVELAKKVALARKLEHFLCKKKEGCRFCLPYESVIQGKATYVGQNTFGQDMYVENFEHK
jgi:ATP-dependent helicase/DNAse subunit B